MAQASPPSIAALEQRLAGLQAGQRIWFWCGPETSAPHPPLLIHPLSQDPEMSRLQADILKIPRVSGAPEFLGLGSIDTSGTLQLGSAGVSKAALRSLALWTAENIAAHPGLARLRNTTMLKIDGNQVTAVHSDDTLWAGIPELVLPGTMAHTARNLAALGNNEEAWFWMSAGGPDGHPFLALEPRTMSPADFSGTVRELLLRSPAGATGIKGVARLVAGRLMLTSSDDIHGWQDILAALQPHGIPRLAAVGILRISGGRIQAAEAFGNPGGTSADLSKQSAVLSALSSGDRAWFWFTGAGRNGDPTLLLATERSALRPLIKAARADGPSCKGQVRLSKKNWLEFQTRDQYDDFIEQLAVWVAIHQPQWPALEAFIGARMTRRDAEGNIIDRIKNDRAWK